MLRRAGLALLGLLVALLAAPAASADDPPFTCSTAAGTPPLVRAEGLTELIGDIVLNCEGGTPTPNGQPIPRMNFTMFLNTNVTSRLMGTAGDATEALLLIDEPAPANQRACQANCTATAGAADNPNVFQGRTVPGQPSQLTWLNVPVNPPGSTGTRRLRFENIRVDAAALAGSATPPAEIVAFVSVGSGNPGLALAQRFQPGLLSALVNPDGSQPFNPPAYRQCENIQEIPFAMRFREGFTTAFKRRNQATTPQTPQAVADENVPGMSFLTETGFLNQVFPQSTEFGDFGTAGLADSGVRVFVGFSGVPPGVKIITPDRIQGFGGGGGELRRVVSPNGQFQPYDGFDIPIIGGQGMAVWEVLDANAGLQEFDIPFGVLSDAGASSPAEVKVVGNFAPFFGSASTPFPIPRFIEPGTSTTAFRIDFCETNVLFPIVSSPSQQPDQSPVFPTDPFGGFSFITDGPTGAARVAEGYLTLVVENKGPEDISGSATVTAPRPANLLPNKVSRTAARRSVVLASKRFSLPAGRRKTLRMRVTPAGRRLLRGRRRALRAQLTLRLKAESGATKTLKRPLKIKPARRGRR